MSFKLVSGINPAVAVVYGISGWRPRLWRSGHTSISGLLRCWFHSGNEILSKCSQRDSREATVREQTNSGGAQ